MGRTRLGLILAGLLLLSVVAFTLIRIRDRSDARDVPAESGTSVVVLVDFSKSFAASRSTDGRLLNGLTVDDKRALKDVASAVAELSTRYWTPPLKTVWTQIQGSSITASALCAPLETLQKLVKAPDAVGTREEIEKVLCNCADNVVEASKDKRNLGDYTDISGGIAMASEIGSGEHSERVLVILSDFNEDLPPGTRQAAFELKGERVILLHRPGTDEPQNISGYLDRIEDWRQRLLQNGAGSVAALPVFAVSQTRLRAALRAQDVDPGTALTVLVDFKDNLFPTLTDDAGKGSLLMEIGRVLADLSRDWPPPVTTVWMAVGPSGFASRTLGPLEFGPSLIKREHALNTVDEFRRGIEELAQGLPSKGKGITITDISGSLALGCLVESSAKSQVLVVISDFVDDGPQPPSSFTLSPRTRVVMLHKASLRDRSDPNSYAARRQAWEERFRQCGAASVCQIPLLSFTHNDVRSCLRELK